VIWASVENGNAVIKHVLQDVGSTFGMANRLDQWDVGYEYLYESGPSWRRLRSRRAPRTAARGRHLVSSGGRADLGVMS